MRARAGIRENFGMPPATGWLLVCAAMPVKRSSQFLPALTIVEKIVSGEFLAKVLPFVVRYLTTNGNSTRYSCKSPFALRYRSLS